MELLCADTGSDGTQSSRVRQCAIAGRQRCPSAYARARQLGDLDPRQGEITSHPRTESGYFAQTNVHTLHAKSTVIEEIQSADKSCLPQTARDIAGVMMFDGDAGLKKISVLSGGEKSRVMLGKLIVTPVNLLLLDEPCGALDEFTRQRLDGELAALWTARGLTIVFVTHSIYEAVFLSTRVAVMSPRPGRIVADVAIDEPFPRTDDFRVSTAFARHCQRLSALIATEGAIA